MHQISRIHMFFLVLFWCPNYIHSDHLIMCHSHVIAQSEVTMRGWLTLLWAQPTPHTITIFALNQEPSM
jgi:hypothetical protein